MIRKLPVLVCSVCQERNVLPYRNLQGTSQVQPYWSPDSERLSLVCRAHGHLCAHCERDIQWEELQTTAQGESPSVFWRVDFWCDQRDCGLLIVAHTRTEPELSHGAVARRIFDAIPQPTCEAGHSLGDLESVIRVEWLGEDGYLT